VSRLRYVQLHQSNGASSLWGSHLIRYKRRELDDSSPMQGYRKWPPLHSNNKLGSGTPHGARVVKSSARSRHGFHRTTTQQIPYRVPRNVLSAFQVQISTSSEAQRGRLAWVLGHRGETWHERRCEDTSNETELCTEIPGPQRNSHAEDTAWQVIPQP
jgi:hypothetical protein